MRKCAGDTGGLRQQKKDLLCARKGKLVELKLRVWCNGEIALGPGKADLLEAIAATGSISAAARNLNMSYRRAWLLVDTMNRCFREPLVAAAAGGNKGGGAAITETGKIVLAHYRRMQKKSESAIQAELKKFMTLLSA